MRGALASILASAGLSALIACNSDPNSTIQPVPTDPQSPTGSAGNGNNSGTSTTSAQDAASFALSERALQGLRISPVPLTLASTGTTATGTVATTTAARDRLELIGLGSYIVNAAGDCNACHMGAGAPGSSTFMAFLGGGTPFELPGGAVVYAPNLTPDAMTGLDISEAQFIKTIRTGQDPDEPDRALVVMPWPTLRWMSLRDLRAIYAYLRAVPPVMNKVPESMLGPFANLPPVPFPGTYNEGDVERPLPADNIPDPLSVHRGYVIQPLATPDKIAGAEPDTQALFGRGSYLVNAISACNDCHTNPDRDLMPGPNFLHINTAGYFAGGRVFTVPPGLNAMLGQARTMSENLSGEMHGYHEPFDTFLDTIIEGVHADEPERRRLGWPMPWQNYRQLILEDLVALDTYLDFIPARTGANDKVTQPYARYCASDADCKKDAGETCRMASNECAGGACASFAECGACQACTDGSCTLTSTMSGCTTGGIP